MRRNSRIYGILNRIEFILIRSFLSYRPPVKDKVVFLTFDDGPEPNITEYVLDQLKRYNFKATFFCTGINCQRNPELFQRIIDEGHRVGNHSYSHLDNNKISNSLYMQDINKASILIKSNLYRPPWGRMNLMMFLKLLKKFKIVYWDIDSGDSSFKDFNCNKSSVTLKRKTNNGSIILFHFSNEHEARTMQLLPDYLDFLSINNFRCEIL